MKQPQTGDLGQYRTTHTKTIQYRISLYSGTTPRPYSLGYIPNHRTSTTHSTNIHSELECNYGGITKKSIAPIHTKEGLYLNSYISTPLDPSILPAAAPHWKEIREQEEEASLLKEHSPSVEPTYPPVVVCWMDQEGSSFTHSLFHPSHTTLPRSIPFTMTNPSLWYIQMNLDLLTSHKAASPYPRPN
ncbi:hypothetical protein Tco_0830768 [Tanacetum coccineum]